MDYNEHSTKYPLPLFSPPQYHLDQPPSSTYPSTSTAYEINLSSFPELFPTPPIANLSPTPLPSYNGPLPSFAPSPSLSHLPTIATSPYKGSTYSLNNGALSDDTLFDSTLPTLFYDNSLNSYSSSPSDSFSYTDTSTGGSLILAEDGSGRGTRTKVLDDFVNTNNAYFPPSSLPSTFGDGHGLEDRMDFSEWGLTSKHDQDEGSGTGSGMRAREDQEGKGGVRDSYPGVVSNSNGVDFANLGLAYYDSQGSEGNDMMSWEEGKFNEPSSSPTSSSNVQHANFASQSSPSPLPLPTQCKGLSGDALSTFLINNSPNEAIAHYHRSLPSAIRNDFPRPERELKEKKRREDHVQNLKDHARRNTYVFVSENFSIPVGSAHGVSASHWNYPVPNKEGIASIWNPQGCATMLEVARIHGLPENGSLMDDLHWHHSPNQQAKKDGATARNPFLSAPGLPVDKAKLLLAEIELPFWQESMRLRALPPPDELRVDYVSGGHVAEQTHRVLDQIAPHAAAQGRDVRIIPHTFHVPFEGIRLEATEDGKYPAREIGGGTIPLPMIYVFEPKIGRVLSSFSFIDHLSTFFYSGANGFRRAAVTQSSHSLFGDYSRITNGFSPASPSPASIVLPPSDSPSSPNALPLEFRSTTFVPIPPTSPFNGILESSTSTNRLTLFTLKRFDDRSHEERSESAKRGGQTKRMKLDRGVPHAEVYGLNTKEKNLQEARKEGRVVGPDLQKANLDLARSEGRVVGPDLMKANLDLARSEGRVVGPDLVKANLVKARDEGRVVGCDLRTQNLEKARKEGRIVGPDLTKKRHEEARKLGKCVGTDLAKKNNMEAKERGELRGYELGAKTRAENRLPPKRLEQTSFPPPFYTPYTPYNLDCRPLLSRSYASYHVDSESSTLHHTNSHLDLSLSPGDTFYKRHASNATPLPLLPTDPPLLQQPTFSHGEIFQQSPAEMPPSSNMGFPSLPVLPSVPLCGSARGGGLNGILSGGLPGANSYQFNAAESYSNRHPLAYSHAPLASTSSASAYDPSGTLPTALHPLAQDVHVSPVAPPHTSPNEKPFQCPTPGCSKSYKRRQSFRHHELHGKCEGPNAQEQQPQSRPAPLRYTPYNFETRR